MTDFMAFLAADEARDAERREHERWKAGMARALVRGEAQLFGARVQVTFPDGRPAWLTDEVLDQLTA